MMFKLLFSLIASHKSGNSTANFHFTAKTSMPKQRKRTQGDLPTSTKTAEDDSPVQTNANSNTVTIKIIAKPGAKHNSVTDISSEGVGIQIAAPPVDGEANAELIRYLSNIFGLRKSDISVDKGSRSRNKSIVISGRISREDILSRLQTEIQN